MPRRAAAWAVPCSRGTPAVPARGWARGTPAARPARSRSALAPPRSWPRARVRRPAARLGPPQPTRENPAEIHQEPPAKVRMGREQALEVAVTHLGQRGGGDGPDAHRPGLAVEERHLADHAARLEPTCRARSAEPARRSQDLDRALEHQVERAARTTGIKDDLPGAEPPGAGELEDG